MNRQLINHCMKWAFLMGAIAILNFILVDVLKYNILSLLFFLCNVVCVVFITINARRTCNGDVFSYGQCFRYIFRLYFFTSFLFSFFFLIYVLFIDTSFLDDTFQQYVSVLAPVYEQSGVDFSFDYMEQFFTPTYYTSFIFVGYIFSGLFMGLICSFFLKKSPSIFDHNNNDENTEND